MCKAEIFPKRQYDFVVALTVGGSFYYDVMISFRIHFIVFKD